MVSTLRYACDACEEQEKGHARPRCARANESALLLHSVATRTQYAIVRTDRFVENGDARCDMLVRNAAVDRPVAFAMAFVRVLRSLRSFTIVDERATCFRFVG